MQANVRMKIGFIATHPIQYHAPLYRELARRDGIDLTVCFCHKPTPSEQGDGFGVPFEWDVDLLSGYRHIFLKNVSKHPARGFFGYDTPEIAEIVHRERFDWVIVQGWNHKACWQAFRACWRTGTKLGVRSDSPVFKKFMGFHQEGREVFKLLIYPFFFRRFDVCFPYGSLSADYFRHYGAKKIVISPHFVDNDFFLRSAVSWSPQRDNVRREWGIPTGAVCFLFCGKFQKKKLPLEILKALRRLIERVVKDGGDTMPPVHLLMVGDGELRPDCEQYVRAHHLPVTFAGFLNQGEIAKSYAVADCLVLASDSYETWGLVVNEAMASGLPAIVSDACGCAPDLIRDGVTGFSFPFGNVTELADRMYRIWSDRELLMRVSKGARRHISSFSVERAADTLLHALQDQG